MPDRFWKSPVSGRCKMRSYRLRLFQAVLISAVIIFFCSCEEDPDDATGNDVLPIKIVILSNGTNNRLAGAKVVIDNRSDLTGITNDQGECDYMLKKSTHSINISRIHYTPLDTTFIVTSTTSIKYFTIYNN
jgi:hypothetical protein